LWTSDARPGREHDMSAARADPDLLARVTDRVSDGALALGDLGDLGYEGEPETFTIPFKKPKDGQLSIDQQTYNPDAQAETFISLGDLALDYPQPVTRTLCSPKPTPSPVPSAPRCMRQTHWRAWDAAHTEHRISLPPQQRSPKR
jgi:hypothetical protein